MLYYLFVWPAELIKSFSPKIRTWHIEHLFALVILVTTTVIFGKSNIEWIGVAGVYFTFSHACVAARLSEKQEFLIGDDPRFKNLTVPCFRWLDRYFYAKEVCWLVYFCYMGSISGLIGVFTFLTWPRWRKLWRKHHPAKIEMEQDHDN